MNGSGEEPALQGAAPFPLLLIGLSDLTLGCFGNNAEVEYIQRRLKIIDNKKKIIYTIRTNVLIVRNKMSNLDSLYDKIVCQNTGANIPFSPLCELLKSIGFSQRVKGDHFIFSMDGIEEIINIQPDGSKAKPYQVCFNGNKRHLNLE